MTQTHADANALLMSGSGSPTWRFDGEGVAKSGTITAPPQAKQEREYDPHNPGGGSPKFFPSGDPIMGITVEVLTEERDPSRTDDDGKRTFYIEGKRLKDAVRDAVRRAGASGLEVGGRLDVALTHYDTAGDRRSGRNWRITYIPAGNAALMSDQAPAPVPAQQPVQQVPVQPVQPAPATPMPMTPATTPTASELAAFEAYKAAQAAGQI